MVDEFELAFRQLNSKPRDEFETAFEELQLRYLEPAAKQRQQRIKELERVPETINRTGGLPVGGEPMVGGPDVLAMEPGQTKTFMEDEAGKPVEVRRAQAIDIGGKIIQEPISPDGMTLDFRGNLIKEKYKELSDATKLPITQYRDKALTLRSELSKLQETQQAHEANQLDYLSRLITRKPGVSVDVETGIGEGVGEGEITTVPIQTRTEAATKTIQDQREFIDNIIGNDKFLDYAKTKGIDVPGMMSRMAGQYLGAEEAPARIEELKKNPDIRKLAEEWAMTSPDFMDTATDIFKRAWDGYAGAIGSGTIGPIGLLLKEAGLEQTGQSLIDAADYADQQRMQGQDPRKVGALAQFGRDASGGIGFTGAAIVTGALGNAARASLGLNSARAINLFQKANTLTFSGLNSAWQGYSEARADGATDEQAKQAALFSGLTQAPLELLSPLQKWVSRFEEAQGARIYKGLNKAAAAIAEGAQEAFANEMPQQIVGNLVKKYVYNPNQDIFEGVAYSGEVGGASGLITSILTQMLTGKKAKSHANKGDQVGAEETDIEAKADAAADKLAPDAASDLAQQMTAVSGEIDNLKQEIADDEMGLQAIEKTAPEYQSAQLALNEKKANLAQLQTQFDKLSAGPATTEAPAAKEPTAAAPSATKEEAQAKIEELNKEFDALDENDQAGIDRVNKAIFAEQNKIAELTAIEQGIDPQATTPTRQPQLPESGRRSPFGTFYPDRPILQKFMSATDKAIGAIQATGKRAQKLKTAIRTAVTNNAGFLAGTDTQVISTEEYNKLTGQQGPSADSGTYKAAFIGGKKYLVIPDINVLEQTATKGQERAASRDAALDQEARAAAKKLEEEIIHLSVFQGIQDEYKGLKNPKLTEQEYIVKRLTDISNEVQRTNPNALPGVSEVYLNQKNKNLDSLTFSQEFLRMVAQRVRTGQITEDLNAIRAAEKEAFSDKGVVASWKNSLLNALKFLRTSIARYLGKGTSTKEVEKMLNRINTILDEYGIVKGEANYEFKDYSAAQPKGEVKVAEEAAPTVKESLPVEPALSETITPAIEARAGEIDKSKTKEDFRKRFLAEEVSVTKEDKRFDKSIVKRFGLGQANVVEQKNLSEIIDSPSVFHESNLDSIRKIVSIIKQGPRRLNLWVSNSLDLALGQGGKGYVIELDTKNVNGSIAPSLAAKIMGGVKNKETELKVNKTLPEAIKSILAPNEKGVLALKNTTGFDRIFDFDNAVKTERGIRIPVKSRQPTAIEARAGVTANITTSDQDTGAYHYGDGGIGRDTTLSRMDAGRSTGHFGTGTYFLGKKESGFARTGRPVVNIDLQGLNMAKPSRVNAIRLHDGLKRFNRSIFKNEKIEFDQPSSNGSRALNEIYIPLIGQAKETDVMNAMEKVESIFKNGTNDGIRTPSTYLMQELGFDGIDVRGTQVDNTDYGSVVFAKPAPTAIEARAGETPSRLYAETFELFNRYTEPQGMQTIKVEANNVEEAKNLIRRTEDYKRIKSRYPKVFSMGDPIPSPRPGESPFQIEAKAGVTPQMDAEYAKAINGDTGNDTITPKTNQEAWANKNPKSASKIKSLIFQRLEDVGHLWKGTWRPPMYKATSKDVDSANGEIGSFFAETKEHAMDYMERGFKIFSAYIKMENPATSSDVIRVLSKAFPQYAEQFKSDEGDWGAVMSTGTIREGIKFVKAMQDAGYDGVAQWDGSDSVAVVFNPNQAKSADLATFDNKGKVIPISQRFSPESPLLARAGVTPEGKPMSKKSESEMKKISNQMISDLERLVEGLKPKRDKALTEYTSRTTKKGKKYPQALISEYSVAANVFTSNAFTAGTNALNKIFAGNPDVDFFRVAQDIGGMDEAAVQRAYSINSEEQLVLSQLMYKQMPVFRSQVMDSNISLSAREEFALNAIKVEADLARKVVLSLRESGRKTQYASPLRNIGGAGTAIAAYKSNITDAMGKVYALTKAPFENIANVIRGDRRKSVDSVVNIQSVFRKAVSLIKQAQMNPEKVRQSIRAEVGKKKNKDTRDILLEFCGGLFDTKEDRYANMIVDQTVQNILAIGMNRKGFSIDNVSNFMYQSFATAAKQMGVQLAGVPKQQKGKRSGKYLEMVKAVIGNDNAYKAFLADLSNRMAEKYPSKQAFNDDFADLFKSLRSNEWSDSLRTQAIKDSADFLNYKFADLFTYIGEKRNAAQAGVREHIRAELRGTGASNELIDKFIADADAYLNKETNRILRDTLGFTVNEETGKVSPKPLISKKIKEEAEAQFKSIKNLKDITKLSMTDEGNFKEGLISRIITEIGMSKESATELADMLSSEIDKALAAQRSENLTNALKKATDVLTDNKIKRKTNQRTLLQRLIEMANMGVLDSEMVYEAFRQTHDFNKNFLPYDAEFVNTIRQWGDRISLLPEGVIRSIEEEKMGRALQEKNKFTGNDILSSYWYWSLLSQISTPTLNIVSGSMNLLTNMFVWSTYNKKTAIPMLQGFYAAISGKKSPAVNSFLYVMRFGLNPSGMEDERRGKYPKVNVIENAKPENAGKIVTFLTTFGDGRINFLPDLVSKGLNLVSPRMLMRSLRASDAFLKEVALEAKLAQAGASPYSKSGFEIARRQAELELVSSQSKGKQKEQEIIIRANEIYRDQRAEKAKIDITEVGQDALETIYGQEPKGIVGRIARFVNGALADYAGVKFFAPFTNVVANVTNEFINYTPGLSQYRLYEAKKKGVNDPFTGGRPEKEWELFMKGMIGFGAFILPAVIQAFQSGDEEDPEKRPPIQFYAQGPRDPKQNRIWAQSGGIKYSIRVGDKYFSLLGTPLVVPFAMSSMLSEEIQDYKKKLKTKSDIDYTDAISRVLFAAPAIAFTAVFNQSFLTGVADIFGLTQAKDPVKEGQGIMGGIISRMLVPGQLRDLTKLTTDQRAVGSTWASNLIREMPGAIGFLNKDVNYFGDPARYPALVEENGVGRRLASLIGRLASTETPDPGFKIMYDLELIPPSWDSSLKWSNGKRMTKEEELNFIRTAGPRMRDWIVDNEYNLKNPTLTEDDEAEGLTPQEASQKLLNTEISKIRAESKSDLEREMELDFSSM